MTKYVLAGAAGVALAASAAVAAPAAAPSKPAPHAQRVAKTELRTDVQAQAAKMFAQLDTNKDGFVTDAEMDAKRSARIEKIAARLDPA
jgi:hypothetical protein